VLAALLTMPSLAQADHGPPVGGPELQRYLEIAQSHWGVPAPTCTTADGQTVSVHAALYDDPDDGVSARAELPGCRIWLDRDFWPRQLDRIDCTIIVHEWGHLLGHAHDGHRNSLMYEQPTQGAPGCSLLRAAGARPASLGLGRAIRPVGNASPHLKQLSRKRAALGHVKRRCVRKVRRAGSRRLLARRRAACVRHAQRRR
jgi:hypothetical protein